MDERLRQTVCERAEPSRLVTGPAPCDPCQAFGLSVSLNLTHPKPMTESPALDGPAPMEGHGAYNRSSRVQATGSSAAVPSLEKAARQVDLAAPPEPIVIADYGSSEGHNSLSPLTAAIGALRERIGRERAISVVHTDLQGNNFTALFKVLASDPDSYLRGDPAVFPMRGRKIVLRANSTLVECDPRVELLGGPMAQPGPGVDPRSGAGCLQSRRGRASGFF